MGTQPEQAAADPSSDAGNHKTVFPLRYFHSWIAVVCRVVGLISVVVHHDALAASLSGIWGLLKPSDFGTPGQAQLWPAARAPPVVR
jgi:hypothetical protein